MAVPPMRYTKINAKNLQAYNIERKKNASLPKITEEQGWRSGESARLLPMWPGFDSRTRCHMWAEFVVGSLLTASGFPPGTPVFPSPQKPTFLNSYWCSSQKYSIIFRAGDAFLWPLPLSRGGSSRDGFNKSQGKGCPPGRTKVPVVGRWPFVKVQLY